MRSEQVGWSCAGLLPLPAAAVAYPGACYALKSQIRGAVKTCAPSFQRQGLARGPKGLHTRLLRPLHSPCGSAARLGGSRVSARRGARAVSRGIVDSPRWDPGTAGPTRDRGGPEWLVGDPRGSDASPGRARAAPRPGIIYGPTLPYVSVCTRECDRCNDTRVVWTLARPPRARSSTANTPFSMTFEV